MEGLLWLPLAIASYVLLGFSSTIDRIIVHAESTKPVVVSFWVAVFSVPTLALILIGWLPLPFAEQFRFIAPDIATTALIIVSGCMTQLGLLCMYHALARGEVTRVTAATGAITPVITIIISYFILNEQLGWGGLVAVALLVVGTIVLTLGPKRRVKNRSWLVFASAAAALLAAQSVLMKLVFENAHFITAYALTGAGALVYVVGCLLLSRQARQIVFGSSKPVRRQAKQPERRPALLIFGNSLLGGLAVITLNLALKLGSPTFVNALRGVQYAMVFVVALVLAGFFPRLLDEELNRRSILIKLSGILLVANGVIILALQ